MSESSDRSLRQEAEPAGHERASAPPSPKTRAKKAYTVTEDDEGRSVVVFAKSGAEARRMGGHEHGLTFEEVDSCRRSPEFDAYVDAGKVPPLVMIEHGWWFECDYCGHRVDSGAEGPDGEELHIVADGARVYCNNEHLMAEWRRRRTLQDRMNAVVEACAIKFHGWPISDLRGHEHYKAGGRDTVACCDFDFPGRKGMHARWDLGDASVYISECDREAWKATAEFHQTASVSSRSAGSDEQGGS